MAKRPVELSISEELDFHYLLQLLPALSNEPEFAWLPELFSIIELDSLIKLCRYCGGEEIKIPTISQLSTAITALQFYYDTHVSKKSSLSEIPIEYVDLVKKISTIYE